MRSDCQRIEPAHQQSNGSEHRGLKKDGEPDRNADLHQFLPLRKRNPVEFAENAIASKRFRFMRDP
ncbi:hypothetical protein D3C81_2249550 [compost metagenome]